MKAIIIDDEPKARNLSRILAEENRPKTTQIFEAGDLLSGVAIIKEEAPSIVSVADTHLTLPTNREL